jgi:tRNA(adenine34) deaminase
MYMNDEDLMAIAFEEVEMAYNRGECPIGAVIARNGEILARAGNRELELNDPTSHAEILVLREAGQLLKRPTFPEYTVYATLWPCPMCLNALLAAKIPKVLCGARSFMYIYKETFDPSRIATEGPIMTNECRSIFIKWLKDTGRNFILDYENI